MEGDVIVILFLIMLVLGFILIRISRRAGNALVEKILEKGAEKRDPHRYDQKEAEKLADQFKDSNTQ